ncbi:putative dehydrogenase [Ruminiclostridium sufflavum DSM 19573]|uniref:Putative dehydrogenase n=1 Tax=Ruminiclostridium sufflavum DSM 19573 TaxID=1121337 RepID=A0A318YCQ0_9FIRM|nr:Gfo/Idh/MocA family oxidoreductase [Ruminiclostridium sufflavum]PYG90392.1 putative dehydrogenase [Ruminiclostridium sufflavum DSM 19573]
MKRSIVRYGMVGGSLNSFIGRVHKNALNFEISAELVAGSFSSNMSSSLDTGNYYSLASDRVYSDYREMAARESLRDDKIDFVCIVTPNSTHYEIAREFLLQDINVVCEKPLCADIGQAEELQKLANERGLLFAVTYTYSGYGMVKQARQLIAEGKIGKVINVNAEYLQEWLIDSIGSNASQTAKLSGWRTNPDVAGISNCVGDIGTHIENTVAYMTGLKIKRVAAKLDYFNQPLDLNANMLIDFDNGASGVYSCSQVAVGYANGLTVRIFGTNGAIEWRQEQPNQLKVTLKGQPSAVYERGTGYITGRAAQLNRIPSGHPEGYYEAFANVYKTYLGAVLKKINGESPTPEDLDFPKICDGVEGVRFIHAAVKSSRNASMWTDVL